MRLIAPAVERCFPLFGQRIVIGPLRLQQRGQTQQPVLAAARIDKPHGDKPLEITEFPPVVQPNPARLQQRIVVFQQPVERHGDPLVLRAVIIHRKHLGNQQHGPCVVPRAVFVRAGADPAVRPLGAQDGVDIPAGAGDHVRILQQIRERDKAVQPVGDALPALPIAADPRAALNVGPDFVQIAAQPRRLQGKLAAQPAARLQLVRCIKAPALHTACSPYLVSATRKYFFPTLCAFSPSSSETVTNS